MAYSKFNLILVKKQFDLRDKSVNLFEPLQLVEPSSWLLETLETTKSIAYFSEKSRSETIVMPILAEVRKRHNNSFAIYSGAILDIDKKKGLNGEIDFILGRATQNFEVEAPLFCLLEAKDNDIEMGIGQCAAQMIATRMLNEKEGYEIKDIYGCVTTGEDWQFLKLVDNILYLDNRRYYLRNLNEILAVLFKIVA